MSCSQGQYSQSIDIYFLCRFAFICAKRVQNHYQVQAKIFVCKLTRKGQTSRAIHFSLLGIPTFFIMSGMILLYTNLVHIQYRRMKLFILQKKVKILKIKIEVNLFCWYNSKRLWTPISICLDYERKFNWSYLTHLEILKARIKQPRVLLVCAT